MNCQTLEQLKTLSKYSTIDNGFMVRQDYDCLTGHKYRFEDDTIKIIDDVIILNNLSLFTKNQEKFFLKYLDLAAQITDGTISYNSLSEEMAQFDQWLGSYVENDYVLWDYDDIKDRTCIAER